MKSEKLGLMDSSESEKDFLGKRFGGQESKLDKRKQINRPSLMIPPNKLSNITHESQNSKPLVIDCNKEEKIEAQDFSNQNSLETRDDSKSSLANLMKQ